jgi:hypothetical protein
MKIFGIQIGRKTQRIERVNGDVWKEGERVFVKANSGVEAFDILTNEGTESHFGSVVNRGNGVYEVTW